MGMLSLSRQNEKGGIRYGINRSTEQKLQRGLHRILRRKETAEIGHFPIGVNQDDCDVSDFSLTALQ